MSDKGILEWFGRKKESSVSDGSRSHAMAVTDTVSELKSSLKAMAEGDRAKAVKGIERLMLCEQEADRIEDRLTAEISRGEMSVQEREDLIVFVRDTDEIANWAKEAAIHEQLIIETGAQVPPEIWAEAAEMAGELETESKALVDAIAGMRGDPRAALSGIDAVFDQERIIDGLYFQGIKHAHMSQMDAKAVVLVDRMIDAMEKSADSGKSCGDMINILIASRGVR